MSDERSGSARLRAWRTGKRISRAERRRRKEDAKAAGGAPTVALSQAQAAARVGASQAAWSDWETGAKQPRAHFLAAIERETGIRWIDAMRATEAA